MAVDGILGVNPEARRILARMNGLAEGETMDAPKTMEDVILWIASFQSANDERWKYQESFNQRLQTRVHDDLKEIESRLSSLERKIMWLTGAAAAAGGLLGHIISRGWMS